MRMFDAQGPLSASGASERIMTIPNLLSLARILALPIIYLDLTAGRLWRALVVLFVVSWTDWFDGYLARRLQQQTRLGALLDPIGDRALFIVVGLGLVLGGLLPAWALVLLLVREGLVVAFGAVLLLLGRRVPDSSRLGKVATFGLMLALILLVAAAALGGGASTPARWLHVLAWATFTINLTLTYVAAFGYARAVLAPTRP